MTLSWSWAQHITLMHKVAGDRLNAKRPDAVEIGLEGSLAFGRILLDQLG